MAVQKILIFQILFIIRTLVSNVPADCAEKPVVVCCTQESCGSACGHPINFGGKTSKVHLQFNSSHSFRFAGYYAAKEKEFYAGEGLDVVFKQRHPVRKSVQAVLEGEAAYGVADSGLILDRMKGRPVVVLKQILQHSPIVFISLKESHITSPYEMVDKRVMFYAKNRNQAPLMVMLMDTIGGSDRIISIPQSSDYEDLASGKADVIAACLTDRQFAAGNRMHDVNIINPQSYGIDMYGDNLFTTETEIANHPERVDRMIRATLKGWEYALKHPEEIIGLIIDKYDSQLQKEQLTHESIITFRMSAPGLIPLGSVTVSRYKRIARIFARAGHCKPDIDLGRFIYKMPGHATDHQGNFETAHPIPPKQRAWLDYSLGWKVASGAMLLLALFLYCMRRMSSEAARQTGVEEGLKKREKQPCLLLDVAAEAVFIIGMDGIILGCNIAASSVHGYSRDELVMMPITKIFNPLNHRQCSMAIEAVSRGKEFFAKSICVRKDGSSFTVEEFHVPVLYKGIKASHMIIREITECMQAGDELIKLSRAVEQIPVPVAITDAKGTIEHVNPRFSEIIECRPGEVIGRKLWRFGAVQQPPDFYNKLRNTIRAGREWHCEFTGKKENGDVYWADLTISPILNDKEQVVNFVATQVDITERQRTCDAMKNEVNELAEARQAMLNILEDLENAKNEAEERTVELQAEINARKKVEQELLRNVEELERFSQHAVGREKRMITLKEEINKLMIQMGNEEKYPIVK